MCGGQKWLWSITQKEVAEAGRHWSLVWRRLKRSVRLVIRIHFL